MNYNLSDFITDLAEKKIELNEEIYNYLSVTDTVRLSRLWARLNRVKNYEVRGNSAKAKSKRGQKSKLVGEIFEQLIRVILDGCKAVTHDGNVRSTTSEIDFRLKFEPVSLTIPMFNENGSHAIGEAKFTTNGSVKIEWYTELSGLLGIHNASLAILFVATPTKKLRSDHKHCLSLIAAREGRKIVPFGIKQIEEIRNGGNFLKILSSQYISVLTHSSDLHV